MAYSNDAFLSLRLPDTRPELSAGTPLHTSSKSTRKCNHSAHSYLVIQFHPLTTVHFGRTDILDKLNDLIGYCFSPVGVPSSSVHYDIAVLSQEVINSGPRDGCSIDKDAVGGILATLHSQVVHSRSGLDRTMTLHQSFVLQRRTDLDDDSGLDDLYVSFQTFR
jgi:hypothetical protein